MDGVGKHVGGRRGCARRAPPGNPFSPQTSAASRARHVSSSDSDSGHSRPAAAGCSGRRTAHTSTGIESAVVIFPSRRATTEGPQSLRRPAHTTPRLYIVVFPFFESGPAPPHKTPRRMWETPY
ncbi:hypothetical protein GY45DRAFT_296108 [Cubamyces sp. BRFM 1775]|nr:hypothetical protein GY45DRAFT_296108 [Cubamyces sp. BRFM 1775]